MKRSFIDSCKIMIPKSCYGKKPETITEALSFDGVFLNGQPPILLAKGKWNAANVMINAPSKKGNLNLCSQY